MLNRKKNSHFQGRPNPASTRTDHKFQTPSFFRPKPPSKRSEIKILQRIDENEREKQVKESQDALLLLAKYSEAIDAAESTIDPDKRDRVWRAQAAQIGITLLWALTCLTLLASLIPGASADPKTEQYPIEGGAQKYQNGCALPKPYNDDVAASCRRLYTGAVTKWSERYGFHGEFCQTDFACLINGVLQFFTHERLATYNTFQVALFKNEGLFDMYGWTRGGNKYWDQAAATKVLPDQMMKRTAWPEDVYKKQFI